MLTRGRLLGAVAIIAIVALYFAVLPSFLVGQYKDDAEPAQVRLNSQMEQAFRSFRSKTFSRLSPSSADVQEAQTPSGLKRVVDRAARQAEKDLDAAEESIRSAEDKVSSVEDELTGFMSLPGHALVGSVDRADNVKGQESEYVQISKEFLSDYGDFVEFSRSEFQLSKRAIDELVATAERVNRPDTSISEAESGLEEAIAGLRKSQRKYKDLQPPTFMRDLKQNGVESVELLLDTLSEYLAALKTQDLGRVTAADADLERESTRGEREYRRLIRELQTTSSLAESIGELRALNRRIERGFAAL